MDNLFWDTFLNSFKDLPCLIAFLAVGLAGLRMIIPLLKELLEIQRELLEEIRKVDS